MGDTRKLNLTTTPQNIGAGGIRIQSRSGSLFFWCRKEGSVAPTDLTICFEDRDVWIPTGNTVWIWSAANLTVVAE